MKGFLLYLTHNTIVPIFSERVPFFHFSLPWIFQSGNDVWLMLSMYYYYYYYFDKKTFVKINSHSSVCYICVHIEMSWWCWNKSQIKLQEAPLFCHWSILLLSLPAWYSMSFSLYMWFMKPANNILSLWILFINKRFGSEDNVTYCPLLHTVHQLMLSLLYSYYKSQWHPSKTVLYDCMSKSYVFHDVFYIKNMLHCPQFSTFWAKVSLTVSH